MRETDFIQQNKRKWTELEGIEKGKKKDPDALSDLFIEVTNDLSFSRTHYANRSIKVYLNNLAMGIHSKVYRNRLGTWDKFRLFWIHDLPKVMYESRRSVLIATLFFVLAMAIGVLSSMKDPGFARHILGDSYVSMTEEFIATGDPMAVYKQRGEMDMFLGIALNNIRVSFLVFVLGAFFGIGSISVLVYNGVMVGTFQYFFIERGLFRESFLTIWMHGMPEIMSIVLAGAAGITLGSGLITPGSYSRMDSFLITARRAIMMMIGIVPVLIFAAFIEGFATRYTEIPDALRAITITLSGAFVVYYFVLYPWRRFNASGESYGQWFSRLKAPLLIAALVMIYLSVRFYKAGGVEGFVTDFWSMPDVAVILTAVAALLLVKLILTLSRVSSTPVRPTSRQELPPTSAHAFDWKKDKTNGKIYADMFAHYGPTILDALPRFALLAVVYVIGLIWLTGPEFANVFISPGVPAFDMFSQAIGLTFMKVDELFRYQSSEALYLLNSLAFTFVVLLSLRTWQGLFNAHQGIETPSLRDFVLGSMPTTILLSLMVNTIFFIVTPWSFILFLLLMPIILPMVVHTVVAPITKENLSTTMSRAASSYIGNSGLFWMILVTSLLFLMLFNSGLSDFLIDAILANIEMSDAQYGLVMTSLRTGLTMLSLAMITPMYIYAFCFSVLSQHEVETAEGLLAQVEDIGVQKRAFGAIREES